MDDGGRRGRSRWVETTGYRSYGTGSGAVYYDVRPNVNQPDDQDELDK